MSITEASSRRIQETTHVESAMWSARQTVGNLELLQGQTINPYSILLNRRPHHAHYFPNPTKEPASLVTRATEILARRSPEQDVLFASYWNADAKKIAEAYEEYFVENGITGTVDLTLPEKEVPTEYQILVFPGEQSWPAQKALELFPWLDFAIQFQVRSAHQTVGGQQIVINTTREGDLYRVDIPSEKNGLKMIVDNLLERGRTHQDATDLSDKAWEDTAFFLDPEDQLLISALLAARQQPKE